MATCSMGFEHPDAEPEPVVVEADPGPNENDVKIAEVEGATRVQVAKIEAGMVDSEVQARIESLEGELRGMREVLDRLAPPEPEPVPEPVIVPVPDPEPAPADAGPSAPPPAEPTRTPSKPAGFWGPAYR